MRAGTFSSARQKEKRPGECRVFSLSAFWPCGTPRGGSVQSLVTVGREARPRGHHLLARVKQRRTLIGFRGRVALVVRQRRVNDLGRIFPAGLLFFGPRRH